MRYRAAAMVLSFAALVFPLFAGPLFAEAAPVRPRIGKVEIMKVSEVRPGMKATAWTVFAGTEPEAVPVEIIA
jgi:hypothetical protein